MKSNGLEHGSASGLYQVDCLALALYLSTDNIDLPFRWLYSSCRQCEICEINHTACPNQKNAGAVSRAYSSQISLVMIFTYVLSCKNTPGTFQREFCLSTNFQVYRSTTNIIPKSILSARHYMSQKFPNSCHPTLQHLFYVVCLMKTIVGPIY